MGCTGFSETETWSADAFEMTCRTFMVYENNQKKLNQADQSLLSAWRKLGSLATHWAHNKDSDQPERMRRLIWVFNGRTCHFVGFVMRWLKLVYSCWWTEGPTHIWNNIIPQQNIKLRLPPSFYYTRICKKFLLLWMKTENQDGIRLNHWKKSNTQIV